MSTQCEPELPESEEPEPELPESEEPEPELAESEEPEPELAESEEPEPEEPELELPEPEESEPKESKPKRPEPEKPGSKIYYCELCKVPCMNSMILQTHFAGMRHKKRERALKRKSNPFISEEPLFVKRPLAKSIRCLKDYMKDPNREEPLIGLEYVLEVQFQGRKDPCYECQLCKFNTEIVPMIEHLIGQRHRRGYIMKHFPDKGKRTANDGKEDRIRFLRRVAREIEKEEGLKMYKIEGYERASTNSVGAKKRSWWAGVFRSENDPVLRQKALEYMDFFEIKSDTEATQVIHIAQSLSEALKAFCENKAKLKYIKSLPPLMPPRRRNTQKPNKPHETVDDNPGDTKWPQEVTSSGLTQLQNLLGQASGASLCQTREGMSSYTGSSTDLAAQPALRKSLARQSGNSAVEIGEWMKQFSQSASVYFPSNPAGEKSLSSTSSQSSYPTQYHQQSSTQKLENRMAGTGIRNWDSMRDSYSPASHLSKDFPSWCNDQISNQMAVSHPVASNSLGWPQSSGFQADGKVYPSSFSGGCSYNAYQQQNIGLNNMMGQSPAGLSSNIMSQLQGRDPVTLTRMLQELVPHYPDLQKIDIYALAQTLSKLS